MAYAFNGLTKTITLTAQTTMSVRDVYSRWADWVAVSDNAKYLPAFSTLGGDSIDPTAGTSVPIYAFLQNGWRVRPMEASHTLTVNDGILLVAGGGDPFLNPSGAFTVRVNYQQPVQAITVSTGGGGTAPTAADNAVAVWQAIVEGGMSAEAMMRVLVAAMAGKSSGAGSATETYKSIDGSKARITATFDAAGNRSGVVVDGS